MADDTNDRLAECERLIGWLKDQLAIHATNTENASKRTADVSQQCADMDARVRKLETPKTN